MIVTVTPNTALDVTYTLERLVPDVAHRAHRVDRRAGGKGVNVARVLHTLGARTCAIGTAGGPDGTLIRADLRAAGISHLLLDTRSNSRRTTTILATADETVTLVSEPGAELSTVEWKAIEGAVRRLVSQATVLVCSGSLPPGVPADAYARLIDIAGALPTILDASGEALAAGLDARPTVVKPNAAELVEVTGQPDPLAAAEALRAEGAGAVLVSLGAEGILAATPQGAWHARPSRPLTGNATGAGDAAVAGIALELAAGSAWPEVLRRAVALSSAAVLGPLAGDFDIDHYRRELDAVLIEEV
ncbi:1-phosphofructokinase family hexose kinase [Amycolatopsis anabasis]|uniref:1-phosphofructokinase family hexose kinase n=1 Tax=Amycolatopsis anabasis TaxID=1840409 RepID=UPI00131E507E|nr:hexose kinase [Amycolatopsis anabasis]